jgi:hypothetical protein
MNLHSKFLPNNSKKNPVFANVGIDLNKLIDAAPFTEQRRILDVVPPSYSGSTDSCSTRSLFWTSRGAVTPDVQSLCTLTDDYWLRIYSSLRGQWSVAVDLSAELLKTLKRSWADAKDIESVHKKIEAYRSRMLSLSIITCAWCKLGESRVLITSQRNSQLAVWTLVSEGEGEQNLTEARLVSFVDTEVGQVGHLACHQLGTSACLLFLGSQDGRVSALRLKGVHGEVEVEALGLVYGTADRARVSHIRVLPGGDSDGSVHLAIAKDKYLLLVDVEESPVSLVLHGQHVFQMGPGSNTAIADVIVMPDQSTLVVNQTGQPQSVRLAGDSGFEAEGVDVERLDVTNYRCLGAKVSRNGALIAILQDVCVYHDSLLMKSKSRLVFLTPSSSESLYDSLVEAPNLEMSSWRDCLEAFRVLATGHEDKAKILERIAGSLETKQIDAKLRLWLSQLCSIHLASSSGELSNLVSKFTVEALCAYALSKLKSKSEFFYRDSLAAFLLKFASQASAKTEAKKHLGRPSSWSCPLCDAAAGEDHATSVSCARGHAWPRCVVSLGVCDGAAVNTCLWCQAMARAEVLPQGQKCTLCGGPFV